MIFTLIIFSAMGYYVYMDQNGDAEGNYSLVSLCEVNSWRRENGQQSFSDDYKIGTRWSKMK